MSIKQQELNQIIESACDSLRDVMNAENYKDYVLTMLFLKYCSDVWQFHYEKYRRQYGDNEARIREQLTCEYFTLPKNTSFYDLYEERHAPNIGKRINAALQAIEAANATRLAGVFKEIDFNSSRKLGKSQERNSRLKSLLEDFNRPNLVLSPNRVSQDIIGHAYMYLLGRFASQAGKKGGQFYTPPKVAELVAKLCRPTNGARICDPTCGSGGLLIEVAKIVGNQHCTLYGMEINYNAWALCRINMFLQNLASTRIELCNTLTSPALIDSDRLMKFDAIVANPPFSLKKWGVDKAKADPYDRFWRGVPSTYADYAFISHMIETAVEKKGRITVVVSHGVLSRGGTEEHIRKKLIQENLLDAVISLPPKLFPNTSIPVAILIFDRSREKGGVNQWRKYVLFINADTIYTKGRAQNTMSEEQVDEIYDIYKRQHEVPEEIEGISRWVSVDEIEENDFNLHIARYVQKPLEEETITVEEALKDFKQKLADLEQAENELASLLAKEGFEL